jgi:hypothetical protein
MSSDPAELGWALAGNVVVGIGAGTATLAAFAPSLPLVDGGNPAVRVGVVSLGFAVFFAGYGLTQAGTYRDPGESLLEGLRPGGDEPGTGRNAGSIDPFMVLRGSFVVLGMVGLGAGMRLFALTIQGWDPVLGVATGVVCILGYIFGHVGINGVVL